MSETVKYYIALEQTIYGPYSLEEVLDVGLLSDTMVCRSGTGWAAASRYPELRELFVEKPRPVPKTPDRDAEGPYDYKAPEDDRMPIYRQKRKAALIGILTLGLAGLSLIGVGEIWRGNLFSGMSFDHGGIGFVMKGLSFVLISMIIAVPFFVISLVRFVYYSIKISNLN